MRSPLHSSSTAPGTFQSALSCAPHRTRADGGTISSRLHCVPVMATGLHCPTSRPVAKATSLAIAQFMDGMWDEGARRLEKLRAKAALARRKVLTRSISMLGNVEHSDHSNSRFLRSSSMDRHLRRAHPCGHRRRLRHHELFDHDQY